MQSFYWNHFLPKVAQGRRFQNVEAVNEVARGRVWTGAQARERGLVDEFGGLDRAVEVAKELAKIPADKGVRRVIYPEPRTVWEQLFGDDEEEGTGLAARRQQRALGEVLPEDMRRALKYASIFDAMKRGEVMAILPYELRIR